MKSRFSRPLIFCAACFVLYFLWDYYKEHRFDKLIAASAKRYSIAPALVKAVIWQETRFNPNARGRAGEIGLMQIRKAASEEWAAAEKLKDFQHEDIFDPAKNISAGSWYLSKLLRRYKQTDDPVPYALADYNAGRGNVLKWLSGAAVTNSATFVQQIGFSSTRKYVENIRERRPRYEMDFVAP